ncbi:hypothetical protein [Clostridium tertium]|uniref:hypothetical protein n=1 Tax=Clostridium tertium TaxID=1559 RepID=UPI0035628879
MEFKQYEKTNLDRLKIELTHKSYYSDEEYKMFLEENGLIAEEYYNKVNDEIKLLNTVIAVLETLANDVDLMRKLDTKDIVSVDQASKYLSQRIYNIKNKIVEIEEMKKEYQGNINPIFFTR